MSKEHANALIVVDVQNDFLPGGNLAVPEGDQVVPIINSLLEKFEPDRVFATKDYHPKDHGSFASNHDGKSVLDVVDLNGVKQVLWPDHCVMKTRGAEISEELELPDDTAVIQKGLDKEYDSYSGFKDANGKKTFLEAELMSREVNPENSTLYVCGLATDYCVKATVIDATDLGYEVFLVIDACRGVDSPEGSVRAAIDEMLIAGVKIVESDQILL